MPGFETVRSTAIAWPGDNIDTDQILPGRFLKTVSRSGLGTALFHNIRFGEDGVADPECIFNRPDAARSAILVTGINYGCGSSREHAPWALHDFGFRVIVARSFADIFYNNALNCGLLPAIVTDVEDHARILAATHVGNPLTVDLVAQTIGWHDVTVGFDIEATAKRRLLAGLDMVGTTLEQDPAIAAFEARRSTLVPWLP